MSERVILGDPCVAEGAAWLAEVEPRFGDVLAATGPWPLRLRSGGYPALVDAIIGQQVSVASAQAVSTRVAAAGFLDPANVVGADDGALRACGLSGQKVRYVRALAEADIDFARLSAQPTDEVINTLVKVPGIGMWTAEIYALFCLGRADVIPAGDMAMQEAARLLFDLEARPTDKELRAMAEDWRPWRGVAARGLWAYYAHEKQREGVR